MRGAAGRFVSMGSILVRSERDSAPGSRLVGIDAGVEDLAPPQEVAPLVRLQLLVLESGQETRAEALAHHGFLDAQGLLVDRVVAPSSGWEPAVVAAVVPALGCEPAEQDGRELEGVV